MGQLSSADTTETQADDEVVVEVDERRQAVLDELTSRLGDAVVGSHIRPGDDLWVRVERSAWPAVAVEAKAMGYTFFDFLSAIDWLPSPFGRDMDAQEDLLVSGAPAKEQAPIVQGYAGGETRFQVFARVTNVRDHWGITLKADVASDEDPSIGTWTKVYAGADWHERETWEMYGIGFIGHPDIRHIYLPGDFEGHPLRKDFPLLARVVKPWPGIVDVEPMPGSDEPTEGDATEGESA